MRRIARDSANNFTFKSAGDIATGQDLNSNQFANSVFYSLAPTNAPHNNNGVGMYLSTIGQPKTAQSDATSERAAQIYFGDTPIAGLYYRVKQGTSGWHPWVSLSTGQRLVGYTTTDAQTYTTDNTGFTTLETTFTRVNPANTSRFLVIATINGAADDDAHARLEYYDGSSWSSPDALIGNTLGNRGSFGDFSVVRAGVMENKQTVQYTATLMHAPASTSTTLGYRVRVMAENVNGCYINRPIGNDGGFNTNTSRSSLLVYEVTGQLP
jgi:hypothetical protein